ncbi:MAG: D-arabinono-1,4-lactone oxidase [Acidimicrobiales bacterium]|nr:D-arabinono-1,4-lactone oxidase [Acidimicrobiales bacterium]
MPIRLSPGGAVGEWANWSGKVDASPVDVVAALDEAHVVATVVEASARDVGVRCVGAAHSHAPLVPTDGLIVDMAALTGVYEVDRARGVARIAGGTRIADLGEPLRAKGVALFNQGDIDRQAIAGAVATGTHGTGPTLQNLSAGVRGLRLVVADGTVVECDADRNSELLAAARLSLGAFGVVTEVTLAVRDSYVLDETMWFEDLDEILDRVDELTNATRHFEFFWLPGKSQAVCKSLAETDGEPRYPLDDEGSRLAWSYDVLANDRPDKHTEMEYSLPEEAGPSCLRELRDLIARDFPDLAWPLEYRTLAADDVWFSSAYERATVTISVHQGVDQDDGPLFRACEEVFLAHGGRPHWGKEHHLTGAQLAEIHPRWDDWWNVRDQWDPEGRFLNDHLRRWRDG